MSDGYWTSTACLLIAALMHAPFAFADQPSFDCEKASSSAEKLICADAGLAALDRQLATRFTEAVTAVEALDAGRDDVLHELRAVQRGWIKGRDDCWKSDDLHGCVTQAYLTRDGDLVAQWMLQEPMALVLYTCAQNLANEVAVYFFDTHLPSVRLEYADSIRTASQVPSASGSKYAGAFGTGFWTKGDTALLTWVEGEEMTCVRKQ